MKNKKTPEIRFAGFTGDWEEKKFKEFIKRKGLKNKDRIDIVPYSVSNKLGLVQQNEQFDESRLDNLDKSAYKIVEEGDFAYNPARINVGSIAFNNLGVSVIVSSLYVVLEMDSKIDNNYILQYIKSNEFIKEVKRNTEGSVREYLFFDSFKNIRFPYIEKEEQTRIGELFKTLDDTIALHEQELEHLKQTKAGFLQKMFPAEGESTPALRFAGFTGHWEEKKLGEVADEIGDGLHGTPKYAENGNIAFINGNNLVDGKIAINDETKFVTSSQQSKSDKKLSIRTILISINGTIGNLAFYNNEPVMLGKSVAYLNIETLDKKFIYQSLQINRIHNHFLKHLTGTTIKNLGLKTIRETSVFVPTLEEQTKIGNFFQSLDNLITLKQKELDSVKKTKQAFLQKMFI